MNAPSHQDLWQLLYLLPVGVVEFESDGRVLVVNPRVVQLLLPVVGPLAIQNAFSLLKPLLPDLPSLVATEPDANGALTQASRRLVDPSGEAVVVEVHLHRTADTYTAILVDITEQAESRRALRREENRYRSIVRAVKGYAIYSVDPSGRIDSWNTTAADVLGHRDPLGAHLDTVVPTSTGADVLLAAARETGWAQAGCWNQVQGRKRWLQTHISPLDESDDSKAVGFVVVTRDRTEERLAHLALEEAAYLDPLTNLPNRRSISQKHQHILLKNDAPHHVLLLDLDHFKSVNDTHGHDIGDNVLVAVAGALRTATRTVDVPGRLGGEEFGVLLPSTELAGAIQAAERIREAVAALEVPLPDGQTLRVTTSIGVASLGDHLEVALKSADDALYAAKHAGRNRVQVAAH